MKFTIVDRFWDEARQAYVHQVHIRTGRMNKLLGFFFLNQNKEQVTLAYQSAQLEKVFASYPSWGTRSDLHLLIYMLNYQLGDSVLKFTDYRSRKTYSIRGWVDWGFEPPIGRKHKQYIRNRFCLRERIATKNVS